MLLVSEARHRAVTSRLLVAVLVASGLGVLGAAPPVSAAPPTVPGCGGAGSTVLPAATPRITSVVGDSFSSGEGTGAYEPGEGYSTFWRHRSPYAPGALAWLYLETSNRQLAPSISVIDGQIDTEWGPDRLAFLASSGAQTKHLVLPQVDPDTGRPRNQPQADGIRQDSNVVIYGFGGNDAHYADILEVALASYIKAAATALLSGNLIRPWTNRQAADVRGAIARETANLPQVQQQVYGSLATTHASAPDAMIVVTLYPVGVKPSGNPQTPFLGGPALDAMHGYAVALNNTIRAAVNQYNTNHPNQPKIEIFDPNTAGSGGASVVAGHEAGQPDSYFNPWLADFGLLAGGEKLHAFQESHHPNRAGSVALGKAMASWLQAKCPGLWPKAPTFHQVVTKPQPGRSAPTPDQMHAAFFETMDDACDNNYSRWACRRWSGGGGGGPVPPGIAYPPPDSSLFELWLGMWVAESSITGSSDPTTTGTGDASTPGGNNPVTPVTPCCGRSVYFYQDDNGDWMMVEYGGDLTGNRYTLLPKNSVGGGSMTYRPPQQYSWMPGAYGVDWEGNFDNPYGYGPSEIYQYYDNNNEGSGGSGPLLCDNIWDPCTSVFHQKESLA
ncbi:SGNH/GDSL hydrolase family protein [Plantactinospora endophytica]|uniref:SGNH hydrolase-type esterase domain-containing protein n=1 Tax=Plantactinospora endophytica TaxID=673535 RepID=A0ABQ4E7V5_9ACTN|nr:hypothetical protein [Plantactinospora endophytica]GIG90802.1 hypothetical protein Pen02_57380 [Plantactinospora endophytica]